MIVAVKKENTFAVGVSISDSSIYMTERDLSLRSNLPFWKIKKVKGMYIGTKTLSFTTDLLRYNEQIFIDAIDTKSIVEKVIPKIKSLLVKYSLLINNREWDNQIVIIYNNRFFRITNFFEVDELDEYVILGDDAFIKTSLDLSKNKSSSERILNAVRDLCRMKNKQLFPLTVFNSANKISKVYAR